MDRTNYIIDRDNARVDDEGRWVTTEQGHHVHISGNGVPDKGNSHVLSRLREAKEYGAPLKREITPPEATRPVQGNPIPVRSTVQSTGKSSDMLKSAESRIKALSDHASQNGGSKTVVRDVEEAMNSVPVGAVMTIRRPSGFTSQFVKTGRTLWKSTRGTGGETQSAILADPWRMSVGHPTVRITSQSEAPTREEINRVNDNVWPDLYKKDAFGLDDFFSLK